MADNEQRGEEETKTPLTPPTRETAAGAGGKAKSKGEGGAGAGAGGEESGAEEGGGEEVGERKVHEDNPWRSADNQTISELYAQVYESLVKSVPSAHAKKVADIVATSHATFEVFFRTVSKDKEGFIQILSYLLPGDPPCFIMENIWRLLEHQMKEAGKSRAAALEAAQPLEERWKRYLSQEDLPTGNYFADGEIKMPFVLVAKSSTIKPHARSINLADSCVAVNCVSSPDSPDVLYGDWQVPRREYDGHTEWLEGHVGAADDDALVLPPFRIKNAAPREVITADADSDDDHDDDPAAATAVAPPVAPPSTGAGAGAAAGVPAVAPAVTDTGDGATAVAPADTGASSSPSPSAKKRQRSDGGKKQNPKTPRKKRKPTAGSISLAETSAISSLFSNWSSGAVERLIPKCSELTTEVLLVRDLVDSATTRLVIDVPGLTQYRDEALAFTGLIRVAETKNWYRPSLKPDMAFVMDDLEVAVLLLEAKKEKDERSDRSKALIMANLSLLRLRMRLENANPKVGYKDDAYSFRLPVILINGFSVEILGCQLTPPARGSLESGRWQMTVTSVWSGEVRSIDDAFHVNKIVFNIVCSLRSAVSREGILGKHREAVRKGARFCDLSKDLPSITSQGPSQPKNDGRQQASEGRKGSGAKGKEAPRDALASFGLDVEPYWPSLPLIDGDGVQEPRLFTGRDLRDCSPVFVKLVDDGDEALLETQLSAELAASSSLFLAPSCAPLVLPSGHQHAVVFPMQSGDRLLDLYRPTPQQFLSIATQLTQALSRLSECEILHGDLKPDNMLYRSDGRLVVLDLGLGKKLEGSVLATGFRGTVEFSAPEVCAFESGAASAGYGVEADTFSAGRVLEFLLERVSAPTEPGDWRLEMEKAVRSMMDTDPARRPKPADAHRLFGGTYATVAEGKLKLTPPHK